MSVLDQQTVIVATVTAVAEPDGHITLVEYWNGMTGLWQTTPPTGIPVGSSIGVRVSARNDGAYVQNMDVYVHTIPPTGAGVDIPGASILVDPAATFQALTSWITDVEGTWQATVTLGGAIA